MTRIVIKFVETLHKELLNKKSNAGIGFTLSTVFYGLVALALVFAVLVSVGIIDNPLGGEIVATAHDASHSDPSPDEPDTQENAFVRAHASVNTQGSGDIDHSGAFVWGKIKDPWYDDNSSASGSGFGYVTFLLVDEASTHQVRLNGHAWASAGNWYGRDPSDHEDDEHPYSEISATWVEEDDGTRSLGYGASPFLYRYVAKSSIRDPDHDAFSVMDVFTEGESRDFSTRAAPIHLEGRSKHSEQQTIEQQ